MNYTYYYEALDNNVWQFEEDGAVITLSNGDTIVYREHVIRILDRLAIQGLPCFTALLLVLGAARRKEISTLLVNRYTQADYGHLEGKNTYLEGTLSMLKIINQLPEEYRRGENELLLLQTLFKKSHNQRTVKASREIVRHFREEFQWVELGKPKVNGANSNLRFALRTLHDISLRFKSVEDVLAEMKNIIPIPPEELALEAVDNEEFSVEELLEDLNKDPLTFRVGSLIKYIWGGMRIPFKNNHPGNQPLGGFADITNKGNFDKLLPSEFANQEVVFLSRLANNEALYFQRELPPVDNQLQRIILIDVSLKNWGTIKTLSHAIMLAIAYHPKGNEEASVFLVGEKYHPIVINSLSGILAGLKKMSTALHPVSGLESYFSDHPVDRQEILFISSPETMQYSEMKSLQTEYSQAINLWIHPTAAGEVAIFKRSGTQKIHVKSIQIPFKEIWKKSKPKLKANRSFKVLEAHNYPILFSATSRLQSQLITPDGIVFEISKNGSLFQTPGPPVAGNIRGWQLVMEKLPIKTETFAIGENEEGERILLMFSTGNKKLILLNLVTKNRQETTIPGLKPRFNHHFEFYIQCFWYPKNNNILFCIELNGKVSEQPLVDHEEVNAFMKLQLVKRTKPFTTPRHYQVFKRSRTVFINQKDQLVFTRHALFVNQGGAIKIETTTNSVAKITATSTAKNIFEFPDGSRITHHRSGMFIFNSSNLAIPAFFVPSILNRGLAIASADRFGGPPYFYYEGKNGTIRKEDAVTLFNRYVTEFVKQILHHGA